MFISPYETTACRNHRVDDIISELTRLKIDGALRFLSDRVYLVGDEHTQLKPFAHPLVLEDRGSGSQGTIIVGDARAVSRSSRDTGELRGGSDFEFLKLRCRLMDLTWLDGQSMDLLAAGDFQVRVFARLMAENLGRRMNLSVETQRVIQILAAYYYIQLFYDGAPVDDEEFVLKSAKRISRSIGIPVPDILTVIEDLPAMPDIGSFTENLVQHGGSVRLERMKPGAIFTFLGGIWFGANPTEQVAVALEHPPTFCAMLQLALSDRSYRKTILGQLIQRVDSRGELGSSFSYHLQRVVSVS